MKRILFSILLAFSSISAQAQLIYGNTFPFWNVTGALTVGGLTTTDTLTVNGATTLTGAVTMSGLVSSLNTNFTGAGITMSGGTSWNLFNTNATTLAIGGAATTITIGAATGTMTIGPAIIGSIATDSTTSTTGAIKTAGGVGIAKNLNVGANAAVTGTTLLTGVTTMTVSPVITTSISPLAADACTAGKIGWDASYIYVCTASGAWKRAALTGSY